MRRSVIRREWEGCGGDGWAWMVFLLFTLVSSEDKGEVVRVMATITGIILALHIEYGKIGAIIRLERRISRREADRTMTDGRRMRPRRNRTDDRE